MEAPIKVVFAGLSGHLAVDLVEILRKGGFAPISREVKSRTSLADTLDLESWDIIIAESGKGRLSPARIGATLRVRGDETPIIALCAELDSRKAIELVKAGASDVLSMSELDRLPSTAKREIKAARKRWRQKSEEGEMKVAAAAFNTAGEGIMVSDRSGRIISINPAFTQLTGLVLSSALGRSQELIYAEHHTQSFFDAQQEKLNETGAWKGEAWFKRADERRFPVWLTIAAVTNAIGEATEYVAIFRDITERKQREDKYRRLATFDPLTELPNRTLFFDRLNQVIRTASRNEGAASLLFIDLDSFKQVNDTMGHRLGDDLLRQVAARLHGCVRDSDTIARIGGDEFAIVLDDDLDGKAAVRVAENAILALSETFDLDGAKTTIGCSVGISMFPQDGNNGTDLLAKADEAMYQAKSEGKGCYQFYEPGFRSATEFIAVNLKQHARSLPTILSIIAALGLIAWLTAASLHGTSNIIAQDPTPEALNNFNTAAGKLEKRPPKDEDLDSNRP